MSGKVSTAGQSADFGCNLTAAVFYDATEDNSCSRKRADPLGVTKAWTIATLIPQFEDVSKKPSCDGFKNLKKKASHSVSHKLQN
jgi:hypothetical protein